MADSRLLSTFRFQISLRCSAIVEAGSPGTQGTLAPQGGKALSDGAFQECSGLEVEMDVQEYLEGGRNDGVIRRIGRAKYPNIVLKRGMFLGDGDRLDAALWQWLQSIVSGARPVIRYDGTIDVLDTDGSTPIATWTFSRGLPARLKGPELNARTGEIAIEELHIAHEGLYLALPEGGSP
jgi:phage tail-like protein